jgi:hypothetical protein
MGYLDELTAKGVFQSRKDAIVSALKMLRGFTFEEWRPPFYYIYGRRYAWVSQKTLGLLLGGLQEEELIEAGRRASPVLAECSLRINDVDIHNPDNWSDALQLLQRNGWGKFELREDKILVNQPILASTVLKAYLEEALGTTLISRSQSDDEAIFQIADQKALVSLKRG